jgi:hypothetical protein
MKIVKVSAIPMSAPFPEEKRHRTDLGSKVKSNATLIRVLRVCLLRAAQYEWGSRRNPEAFAAVEQGRPQPDPVQREAAGIPSSARRQGASADRVGDHLQHDGAYDAEHIVLFPLVGAATGDPLCPAVGQRQLLLRPRASADGTRTSSPGACQQRVRVSSSFLRFRGFSCRFRSSR